ncbi:hypothetical protein MAR_029682 [Mya arenaria]|uniref:Uncharacterized protein n=1 Tax=Mya arenaria TaxID=6604 RepID=A0ABY7DJW3_MYAAR|nr:hypothetical protein MAR_029640 [Mya arenaria]WAQ96992.1 hypothetical protein MAR_029682 [Mya arenaria]
MGALTEEGFQVTTNRVGLKDACDLFAGRERLWSTSFARLMNAAGQKAAVREVLDACAKKLPGNRSSLTGTNAPVSRAPRK